MNIKKDSDFKIVFDEYFNRLCVYAAGIVNDDAVAEDIVQEFFIYLYQKRSDISISKSVKSYCYSSVKNRCISCLRKQNCDKEYIDCQLDLGSGIYANDAVEYKELKAVFDQCLEKLPARCRQVFVLSRLDGLCQQNISEILDICINTIKVQMGKALLMLRNCIILNCDLK